MRTGLQRMLFFFSSACGYSILDMKLEEGNTPSLYLCYYCIRFKQWTNVVKDWKPCFMMKGSMWKRHAYFVVLLYVRSWHNSEGLGVGVSFPWSLQQKRTKTAQTRRRQRLEWGIRKMQGKNEGRVPHFTQASPNLKATLLRQYVIVMRNVGISSTGPWHHGEGWIST